MSEKTGERIAKRMAAAGLASRRQAEEWIAAKRVRVNGKIITSPALNVTAEDEIMVDGEALPSLPPPRLWRYHKPSGLVTTHRDPKGRKTVFDMLPKQLGRVISVGRLDLNSEGLLLLTNSGELARYMELPSTGWVRRYQVRTYGTLKKDLTKKLAEGVTVDGVVYAPIKAEIESQKSANSWMTLSLQEGKNREIRKVLAHFELKVNRLIRLSYGPFQLGNLPLGGIDEVPGKVLREQLGGFFK
ncbi:MAG: pseudouridine synthase [Dongiaceae bacterium]